MLESLESRRMFAADPLVGASATAVHMSLKGSTLNIITLSADNTVMLSRSGEQMKVSITTKIAGSNSTPSAQENIYDLKKVSRISISTGAGDDVVEVSKKIAIPVVVDAGAGSDTISTGSGNDSLYGGTGLDYLWGNEGNDYVDGGAGDDRIIGAGGEDHLWGNTGNDRISVLGGNHAVDGGAGSDRATLIATPKSIKLVERYVGAGGEYLVPVTALPDVSIRGLQLIQGQGTSLVLNTARSYAFSYTTSFSKNTNRFYISLTPYKIANDQPPIESSVAIPLNVPAGTYSVFVTLAGKQVGYLSGVNVPAFV